MELELFLKSVSLENEEWKDVENFVGRYMISNKGRLCGVGGYRTNKHGTIKWFNHIILNIHPSISGYDHHALYIDGVRSEMLTHRLVAKAFIPNPENKPFVDHIDGNKLNNCVENLKWCTHLENMQNPNSKKKSCTRAHNAHLYDVPVVSISLEDNTVTHYPSLTDATKLGFDKSGICMCCRGKRNTHKKHKWMYEAQYTALQNSSN